VTRQQDAQPDLPSGQTVAVPGAGPLRSRKQFRRGTSHPDATGPRHVDLPAARPRDAPHQRKLPI